MVDTLCPRFLLCSHSALLVGFKISNQVFDYHRLDLVAGGGSPYGRRVLDDIHESIIRMRSRYDDKFVS